MKRFVLVSLVLLGAAGAASACNYVRSYYYTPAYVAPVAVPVFVSYPVYSVSYDAEKAGIINALNQLTVTMQTMQQQIQPNGGNVGAANPQQLAAVFKQSCLECHAAAVADTKGGGFPMFDQNGELREFTRAELRHMDGRLNNPDPGQRMPFGKPPLAPQHRQGLKQILQGGGQPAQPPAPAPQQPAAQTPPVNPFKQ